MVWWLWHLTADPKLKLLNLSRTSQISVEMKCQRPMYYVMSVHVKEHQEVEIAGGFHCSVSDKHVVVLGRETSEIN